MDTIVYKSSDEKKGQKNLTEAAYILIFDFFDRMQLLQLQFVCRKFYETTIPRAMIRRMWLPKVNLLHHLTTYIPQGIP